MLMVTRNGTANLKGTVLVAAVMPNENCYCSNRKNISLVLSILLPYGCAAQSIVDAR